MTTIPPDEIRGTEMLLYHLATSNTSGDGSSFVFLSPFEKKFEKAVVVTKEDQGDNNQTAVELAIEMRFNDSNLIAIIVYSFLLLFSAVSNVIVLVTIWRYRCNKGRLGRVKLFLLHLAVADLLVTLLMMPLEMACWNWTVAWKGGDALCRIMAFFRVFGLYLSGFLLGCIALDRCLAVLRPLDLHGAAKRARMMLIAAWTGSALCSLPHCKLQMRREPQMDLKPENYLAAAVKTGGQSIQPTSADEATGLRRAAFGRKPSGREEWNQHEPSVAIIVERQAIGPASITVEFQS